jgi:hypothetical protein
MNSMIRAGLIVLLALLAPLPTLAGSDLPHEFGELVPLYAGAQPVGTRYTRDSVTVRFSCADSYGKVRDFYARALAAAGWQMLPPSTAGAPESGRLRYFRDDMHFSLTDASAIPGGDADFIIEIVHGGGRE